MLKYWPLRYSYREFLVHFFCDFWKLRKKKKKKKKKTLFDFRHSMSLDLTWANTFIQSVFVTSAWYRGVNSLQIETSGSSQITVQLVVYQRFAKMGTSDNGPDWNWVFNLLLSVNHLTRIIHHHYPLSCIFHFCRKNINTIYFLQSSTGAKKSCKGLFAALLG